MRRFRHILPILLLSCLTAWGNNSADDPPYTVFTIPFNEKDKAQKYLVFDVEVNGKKLRALFDTGSATPARMLKTSAERHGFPAGGGKYDITIGKIVIKDVPFQCVGKFNTSYPKDIIFGHGVINKVYAVVDYPSHRALFLQVGPNVTYADADRLARKEFGELADEFALPLVSPDGHILVEAAFGEKKKLHLAVDTGWLGNNMLTSSGSQTLGVTDNFTRLDFSIDGHDFKKIVFKNARFAGLEGSAGSYSRKGITLVGLLGVPDFLGHYRVGIDYKELKLHIGTAKKAE